MSRGTPKAIALRAALLATCWWAITEGEQKALGFGVLAVLLTLAVSLRTHRPRAFSLRGLAHFIPVFLWRSLTGAIDVAWRAFSPSMPLQPRVVEFRTRLPDGAPRVVLANVISLLPGSLCADLHGDVLSLHLLSETAGDERGLRELERTVGRLFP